MWKITAPVILLLTIARISAAGQGMSTEDSSARAGVNPDKVSRAVLQLDPKRRAQIEEAIRLRAYTRAETLLVEEINRRPASPNLLTLLGGIFFLDGKALNAAVAFKKAEALGPLDDHSRFTLAMSYVVLNRRDWAWPELEKLTLSDPKNGLYLYWLARLDYDGARYDAAVTKLQKVIALSPDLMKAYDNLGLCYEALGENERAVESYHVALRLNRQRSPWPALNLGTLLIKLNRLDEAEPHLREALRHDSKFAHARYQLGSLLEKRNKYGEAIQELNQAILDDPAYPEPHYLLGRIYRRTGDREKSEKAFSNFQQLKKQKAVSGKQ